MTVGVSPSEKPVASSGASQAPARAAKPEADLLDHEYDGIHEYDNPLPGWWVAIFWGTIVFAGAYGFHYHVSGNGTSVAQAYAEETAIAQKEQAALAMKETVSEDGLKKLMLDAATLAEAKGIFAQRCTPCHGENAQGVIGPNLTDGSWIHGGKLMEIYHTIGEGVPEKGMPAWKMQLTPQQLRQVAAFVGSIRGKNLPGKAPEGIPVPQSEL